MSRQGRVRRIGPAAADARQRPFYARVLRLRYLNPGGMLCFVFLEGAVAFGLLLALAELVSWWGMLLLPVAVALMVKANDVVAGAVARSVALVPEQERERFRSEVAPAVGRAVVADVPSQGAAKASQPPADEPPPPSADVLEAPSDDELAQQQVAQGPPRQWAEPPDEVDLWQARQSGRRRYE